MQNAAIQKEPSRNFVTCVRCGQLGEHIRPICETCETALYDLVPEASPFPYSAYGANPQPEPNSLVPEASPFPYSAYGANPQPEPNREAYGSYLNPLLQIVEDTLPIEDITLQISLPLDLPLPIKSIKPSERRSKARSRSTRNTPSRSRTSKAAGDKPARDGPGFRSRTSKAAGDKPARDGPEKTRVKTDRRATSQYLQVPQAHRKPRPPKPLLRPSSYPPSYSPYRGRPKDKENLAPPNSSRKEFATPSRFPHNPSKSRHRKNLEMPSRHLHRKVLGTSPTKQHGHASQPQPPQPTAKVADVANEAVGDQPAQAGPKPAAKLTMSATMREVLAEAVVAGNHEKVQSLLSQVMAGDGANEKLAKRFQELEERFQREFAQGGLASRFDEASLSQGKTISKRCISEPTINNQKTGQLAVQVETWLATVCNAQAPKPPSALSSPSVKLNASSAQFSGKKVKTVTVVEKGVERKQGEWVEVDSETEEAWITVAQNGVLTQERADQIRRQHRHARPGDDGHMSTLLEGGKEKCLDGLLDPSCHACGVQYLSRIKKDPDGAVISSGSIFGSMVSNDSFYGASLPHDPSWVDAEVFATGSQSDPSAVHSDNEHEGDTEIVPHPRGEGKGATGEGEAGEFSSADDFHQGDTWEGATNISAEAYMYLQGQSSDELYSASYLRPDS
eukprot:g80352.t1